MDITIQFTLALIGYGFAVFLWKNGFKTYALVYSLIWTNALQTFMDPSVHGVINFLTWMNFGLILIHYPLFAARIKAMFYGGRR